MIKRISILLLSLLFAMSCSENNPNDPNSITLSERAGTYTGTPNGAAAQFTESLTMELNNQGECASVNLAGGLAEQLNVTIDGLPKSLGTPNDKSATFTFEVNAIVGALSQTIPASITIVFDSTTEASGCTATVEITGMFENENALVFTLTKNN